MLCCQQLSACLRSYYGPVAISIKLLQSESFKRTSWDKESTVDSLISVNSSSVSTVTAFGACGGGMADAYNQYLFAHNGKCHKLTSFLILQFDAGLFFFGGFLCLLLLFPALFLAFLLLFR